MTVFIKWFDGLTDTQRGRVHAVSLIVALHLVAYAILSPWLIEDAAISFTFAKHLSMGEGFVAYPGGERVEGFSNPTWTVLLAALRMVGVSPYIAAKLVGAVLGSMVIVVTARLGEVLFPRATGLWPVAPAALVAFDPQFIIWNASGLENSLVVLMLALSALVALTDRPAWQALALGIVAISRPEGPLYAACIGGMGALRVTLDRGPASGLKWALSRGGFALLPLLLWETFSYWYFAYPFPNTYYAKLGAGERFEPWTWSGKGWGYLRSWGVERGAAFVMPLLVLGQTGWKGRRGAIGLALGGLTWLLILPGLGWAALLFTEPDTLSVARIGWFYLLAVFLPVAGMERDNAVPRAFAWWLLAVVMVFVVYVGGDWMVGHRWLSFAALPLAMLVADSAWQLSTEVPSRWRKLCVALALGVPAIVGVSDYIRYLGDAETTPWDISRRVTYMKNVQKRLHIDQLTSLEVDFGGTMWWSGHELIDLAGLNDVSIAQHSWEPEFFGEYLYRERNPEFMHAHGSWASRTQIRRQPEWRNYTEIPGYPVSRSRFHVGNMVRRDLFVSQSFPTPSDQHAMFEGNLELVGWRMLAPEVARDESLYVELAWRAQTTQEKGFRAILYLTDDSTLISWELPPAYDWIPVTKWSKTDVVWGRHTLPLPSHLANGEYDLGIVVLDEAGDVRPAQTPAAEPKMAIGEAHWSHVVTVDSRSMILSLSENDLSSSLALAREANCVGAEEMLERSRRRLHPDGYSPQNRPDVRQVLARCWAWEAEASTRPAAVDAIVKAKRWDSWDTEVRRVSLTLANTWQEVGDIALSRDDLVRAHAAWTDALRADPSRAWLRRTVEEWRDVRLGLAPHPLY